MAERLKIPGLLGELFAEFAGTMILILFGVGVVAQVVAGGFGDHDSIAWAWGLGVTLGVYVAARTSGAHLNPAVTVALAVFKGFEWRKVVPYALAQFLGAFVAALTVRWVYSDVLRAKDPFLTIKTQGVFSTLPGNGALPVSHWTALLDQIVGTAILLFLILAITDERNTAPTANLAPFIIGLLVVVSAWRGEPTPATRSTRPATSGRDSPASSPAMAVRSATRPGISISGSRSSDPSSAAWSAPACTRS